MKRLLPAPLLSVALFVLWLLLNRTVGLGHVLLALVLAWVQAVALEEPKAMLLIDLCQQQLVQRQAQQAHCLHFLRL